MMEASLPSKVVLQYLRYVVAAAEKRSFRQAAIELGIWESTISRGIRELEDEIGVAFLTGEPVAYGCEATRLWEERVLVVLPRHHRMAEQEEISWDDLRDEHFIVSEADPGPEIHDYLVKHLAELGHHPTMERCGVGRDNLMRLVTLGRGLTLTSEATLGIAFPGVVYRPLVGERLPFSAVWSLRNDNPAFRRLLSMAQMLSKRLAAAGSPAETLGQPENHRALPASAGYDGGPPDTVA